MKILRIKEVCLKTSACRSFILEKSKTGEFPAPIKLGVHRVGWIEEEIDEWIVQQSSLRGFQRGVTK